VVLSAISRISLYAFQLQSNYPQVVKILIVDDNATVLRILRRIVESMATEIHECKDGQEAITIYAEQSPDLVLMDIHMPLMDGLTATRLIRNIDPAARVLIVTAYEDEGLRRAAQEAGASGYIPKDKLTTLPKVIKAVMDVNHA
jgi:CheY-like chemotaxis protein